jgi:hypothetical protein
MIWLRKFRGKELLNIYYMNKCEFRKCNNLFIEKDGKKFCSRKCKTHEKYYRKKLEKENLKSVDFNHDDDCDISIGLINSLIKVNISYRNITHYRKMGYNPLLNTDLEIKITDLPSVSHVKVDVCCSLCRSQNKIQYCKYLQNIRNYGFYGCRNCSREKFKMTYIKSGGGNWINKNDSKFLKALKLKDIVSIELSESKYCDLNISNEYLLYRNECRRITNSYLDKLFDDWNGLDFYDSESISENFNLPHNDKKYPTVDHKISIYYGFNNGISPSEIGHISNLVITKRSINSSKRDKIL